MIKAEIVADSLSPQGDRLVSVLCTFPRIILAEVNTHRMLSKNTASSRAIPFNKMVKSVEDYPFIPIAFQKDHKGMQGTEYFEGEEEATQIKNVKYRVMRRVEEAKLSASTGLTKQLVNRGLEEFMWTTMLITGSLEQGWDNFFNLRCPQYSFIDDVTRKETIYKSKLDYVEGIQVDKSRLDELTRRYNNDPLLWFKLNKGAAEIHMMALAECIWDAFNESTPKQLKAGEWHIPFEDKINEYINQITSLDSYPFFGSSMMGGSRKEELIQDKFIINTKVKISTSMGARTSYTIIGEEKDINVETLVGLHDRLIAQQPPHSSPMEHCALCMDKIEYHQNVKGDIRATSKVEIDSYTLHANGTHSAFGWCRNFRGFIPYRHIIETNNN